MADRRMFSKKIIDSDEFLDLSLSAQALYFHLSMRADDDGFVNNFKRIRSMIGASEDDLKLLFFKRFLIPFDTGVVVIRHWKVHNYIQKDRYTPTDYQNELKQLVNKNNGYELSETAALLAENPVYKPDTECIQTVSKMDTQDRLEIEKETGEERDKYNTPRGVTTPKPDLTAFGEELAEVVTSWLAYKAENRKPYKPQGLKALITEIRNNAGRYGETAVAEVIRQSMANGYQGIVFDRLRQGAVETPAQSVTKNPFAAAVMGGGW